MAIEHGTAQGTAERTEDAPVARRIQIYAAIALVFLTGGLFGAYNLQPVRTVAEALSMTRTVWTELTRDRWDILNPRSHDGEGLTVHDPARAHPGLTLVQGLMPGGAQVRLYAMDGTVVHSWPVDFFAIWDNPTHIIPESHAPKTQWNYHTQGLHPFPDGSLLVNLSAKGAARIGKCGEVIWKLDRMAHHSVTRTSEGHFLIPSINPLTLTDESLLPPNMSREQVIAASNADLHGYEDTILTVTEDGEVLSEISVLRAVYDAGIDDGFYDSAMDNIVDPTHLNDIEEVTPALAAKIDGVSPGDLLLSIRNMHMLAILDHETGEVLWYKRGPWVRQHDPDIMADGRIQIYNNRSPLIRRGLKGSEVIAYDPATDRIDVLYPKLPGTGFASLYMGTNQGLPNGNNLIAESANGRVFEAAPDGDIVWELVVPFDDTHASLLEAAERVPESYFEVADWSCP